MNITSIINLLFHGNQLKRMPRTGWVQRGVPNSENVAAHSYGVLFTLMVLAEMVQEPIDLERAFAMAILHDLPEGLTTDIPTPAWRFLPSGVKIEVERQAMREMTADLTFADRLMDLFEELHQKETAVAKLVDDADKLEMYLQAIVYEEQTGNRHLAEFWQRPHRFFYPEAQALYDALVEKRRVG